MITLTDNALSHVKNLISQNQLSGFGLRVAVSSGGCSGFSYVLDIVDDIEDEDHLFEREGLQVFCDPKSYPLVEGITIDYENSLMGGGFKFENPNARRSCGCGTSFQVDENGSC